MAINHTTEISGLFNYDKMDGAARCLCSVDNVRAVSTDSVTGLSAGHNGAWTCKNPSSNGGLDAMTDEDRDAAIIVIVEADTAFIGGLRTHADAKLEELINPDPNKGFWTKAATGA